MMHSKRKDKREGGAVLLVILIATFVVMAVSGSFLSSTLIQYSGARRALEFERAQVVAEAGIDLALFELQRQQDFEADGIGNAVGTLDGASYQVTMDPAFNGAGEYTLTSIATYNQTQAAVEIVVEGGGLFNMGIFGDVDVIIKNQVDSYDSGLGTYASQVGGGGYANANGDVGSNADITLDNGVNVWGDAVPGPTGAFLGDAADVSGSTVPASMPIVLDPVAYAPAIASSGPYTGSASLGAGAYRYDSLAMGSGDTLTITGEVTLFVDGSFDVNGGGQIDIALGAKLTIRHGAGDWKINGNAVVNQGQVPGDLQVYSATAGNVDFTGSSMFFGTIYAPSAAMKVSGSSELFGAVVAKTVDMSPNGGFHFDEALGNGLGNAGFKLVMARPVRP